MNFSNEKKTNDFFFSSAGLATLTPEAIRIIDLLENIFLGWARECQADVMIFPPLIAVEDLNRLEYFRNFPHLGVFTSGLQSEQVQAYHTSEEAIKIIPNTHLVSSNYALLSAACYPIYLYLQNTVLASTKYITTIGKCFRNEPFYKGLERLLCFSLREIVCVGTDREVRLFLTRSKEKISDFAAAIGLNLEIKIAEDPFYDSQGIRAKMQQRFPLKEEFVSQGKLALASVNFHLSFFGERCNIRTSDENFAFSGCVGMGIERWLSVLMKSVNGDVREIETVLNSYLNKVERSPSS